MTPKEIIAHKPPFFPAVEDWNAFLELSNQRSKISHEWLRAATTSLRDHLTKNTPKEWLCSAWGSDTDIKLHLCEFGTDSVFIGYGWEYELYLYLDNQNKFDSDKINTLLRTSEFNPILNALDRIDKSFGPEAKVMSYRNFSFGSPNDGNISVDELAWYVGNRSEEFVQQAIAQIEKFTKNEEVTRLLGELNRRSRKQEFQ